MINVIRWLKGYVRLKVWGYAPERFMNLCTNTGITLWDVAGYGEYYEMCMSVSDFFSIRKIAHKTRTRVAVLERYGLPFFMKDVRKRKVFAAGIVGCIGFLLLMSQFLWSIEFTGNSQITDEVLMDFLKEEGIDYGIRMKNIDLEVLEENLREHFSQITWTSVRMDGSKLTVQVKENDLPPKADQLKEATNWKYGADIIAAKEGQIVEILTRSGIPKVKLSDVVEKGTVLVSGQVPVNNDDGTVREWQFCVSDADILIQYDKDIMLEQPFSYEYKNFTGREEEYSFFSIGQKRYLLHQNACDFIKYDEVVEQKRLQLFSQIDLPIFMGTLKFREYFPVEAVYDEESAKIRLKKSFYKIVEGLEQKGVQIIQKDVKIIRKTDGLKLTGTITVWEEAVLLSPAMPVEEQKTSEDGDA